MVKVINRMESVSHEKNCGFVFDSHDIYVASSRSITQFSAEAQDILFATEDISWWFQYRAQVLIDMAERYFVRETETLDIGGGNGYTTGRMQKAGFRTALLEPSYEACRHAKTRGIPRVFCGTLNEFEEPISQCMMLDVLEHIEDDAGFLCALYSKMSTGGEVLLAVPALQILWSSEDEMAGHFRRYHLPNLCNLLEKSGFQVMYGTYFFSFLFLPVLFVRVGMERIGLLKRQEKRTDEERKKIMKEQFEERKGIIGRALGWFEAWERARLLAGKQLPFGSSVLCVARKV